MTATITSPDTTTAQIIARQIIDMADAYTAYEAADGTTQRQDGEHAAYTELALERSARWADFSPAEIDRMVEMIRNPRTRQSVTDQARKMAHTIALV